KKYNGIQELLVLVALSIAVLEEKIRKKQNKEYIQETTPSGFDKMEDISKDDLNFIVKYANSEKNDLRKAAWETIEAYLNTKRLWKHNEVWYLIENEIMSNTPRDTIHNALFTLKVMLWRSNNENISYVRDPIFFVLSICKNYICICDISYYQL
ncbi:MAG TPA: hypothetical protein VLA74_01640, partial [Nitrososphaeraceae archaeon]|nr:hypothetical protein [Nitrososphaeraceae archaeon]